MGSLDGANGGDSDSDSDGGAADEGGSRGGSLSSSRESTVSSIKEMIHTDAGRMRDALTASEFDGEAYWMSIVREATRDDTMSKMTLTEFLQLLQWLYSQWSLTKDLPWAKADAGDVAVSISRTCSSLFGVSELPEFTEEAIEKHKQVLTDRLNQVGMKVNLGMGFCFRNKDMLMTLMGTVIEWMMVISRGFHTAADSLVSSCKFSKSIRVDSREPVEDTERDIMNIMLLGRGTKTTKPVEMVEAWLKNCAYRYNYRRYQNPSTGTWFVYKEVMYTDERGRKRPTRAWEPVMIPYSSHTDPIPMSLEAFVDRYTSPKVNLNVYHMCLRDRSIRPNIVKNLAMDDDLFPEVHMDRHVFSCIDAVFDARTLTAYPMGPSHPLPPSNVIAIKFHKQRFPWKAWRRLLPSIKPYDPSNRTPPTLDSIRDGTFGSKRRRGARHPAGPSRSPSAGASRSPSRGTPRVEAASRVVVPGAAKDLYSDGEGGGPGWDDTDDLGDSDRDEDGAGEDLGGWGGEGERSASATTTAGSIRSMGSSLPREVGEDDGERMEREWEDDSADEQEVRMENIRIARAMYRSRAKNLTKVRDLRGGLFPNWFTDIQTPLTQRIMDFQGWEQGVMETKYAFMGRQIFARNTVDRLHIAMQDVGTAGTGKSTLGLAAMNWYPEGMVGTLSSNQQQQFGMNALFYKLFVIGMDLNRASVEQGELMQAISGEPMALAQKHNNQMLTGLWRPPIAIISNRVLQYENRRGNWGRRNLVFSYNKRVPADSVQTNMLQDIIDQESMNLIVKCSIAYHSFVNRLQGRDLWASGVLHPYFHNQREQLERCTNPLAAFLHPSANIIQEDPEGFISKSDFTKALRRYCEENSMRMPPMNNPDDYMDEFRNFGTSGGLSLKNSTEEVNGRTTSGIFIRGCSFTQDAISLLTGRNGSVASVTSTVFTPPAMIPTPSSTKRRSLARGSAARSTSASAPRKRASPGADLAQQTNRKSGAGASASDGRSRSRSKRARREVVSAEAAIDDLRDEDLADLLLEKATLKQRQMSRSRSARRPIQ
jgi:hypothetical protein